MTTGEILQSSRLSNELTNTGGDLSDGEVQSRRLSNELVITEEVFRSSRISNEMVTTVHNNSLSEHNFPNRDRQSYGVHLALHHGPAGNSHFVRDVSLTPTGLLVSITTTKTPPLSSETGHDIRLNTNQETDYTDLGLERYIFSDCISGLDGETGDTPLPPPVSLDQNVSPSVPISVPEEETGNAVLPTETQEQITHSVVLTNDLEGETDNAVSPLPGTETGNAVLPVVINTSGGGRETDNAVLITTHSETGDAVSLGPTEGPNHLDEETGNAVPIPSDEATTVTEFFSNNPQRVQETQRNENSKGRGKRKGKNRSGGRGSRTDTQWSLGNNTEETGKAVPGKRCQSRGRGSKAGALQSALTNQPNCSNPATEPSGPGSCVGTTSSPSTWPKWFYVQEVTEEDQKKL